MIFTVPFPALGSGCISGFLIHLDSEFKMRALDIRSDCRSSALVEIPAGDYNWTMDNPTCATVGSGYVSPMFFLFFL